MSLDELERKKLEVLLNLCLGAGWVCWGAWSCDKQEAALPPVAGLHRCGQRTGWWTSTSRRSGWAPGTSCSILLASYSLLILREEECTERRSVVTNGAHYRIFQQQIYFCDNDLYETAPAGCPNNMNVVKTKKKTKNKSNLQTQRRKLWLQYVFIMSVTFSGWYLKTSYLAILDCNWINWPAELSVLVIKLEASVI